MEQVKGIEPSSSAWKADILAFRRHLHNFAMFLMNRPRCQGLLLTAYDLVFGVINFRLYYTLLTGLRYPVLEQIERIELSTRLWQSLVLPLNYICMVADHLVHDAKALRKVFVSFGRASGIRTRTGRIFLPHLVMIFQANYNNCCGLDYVFTIFVKTQVGGIQSLHIY